MMEPEVTISIVTATRNAATHLPALISSLRAQSDKQFEWVIADGASTDGTLELLHAITDMHVVISSQPDFGTYDALNRAIGKSSGRYYVVVGADDVLNTDAIANFRRAIAESQADIISAYAQYGSKCMKRKAGPDWIFGQFSHVAAHTVATAIRKELHQSFGTYSSRYPIAADQYFVMRACAGGVRVQKEVFIAGAIGTGGVSSTDRVGNATEVFRVQVALGRSVAVQVLLLLLRLTRA